jgi:PleD family two-component response regulator
LAACAHYLSVTVRVLLTESGIETTLFLREVLTELDGGRYWSAWVQLQTSYAATCADAAFILSAESIDILLLDLDLPDHQGAEAFRLLQTAAPHVPVVLLVDPDGAVLAERLVREGAQDFLLKPEVDCRPLARAMRNALDRHRLLAATRATAMTDGLTGLLTRPAFLTLAGRDRVLAERLSRRMMILVAEPVNLDGGSQRRDLALVDAADGLRTLAGPAALVARLSPSRFGVAVFDTEAESVEEIRSRFHGKISFGTALFDPHYPVSLDALLEQAASTLKGEARHSAAM